MALTSLWSLCVLLSAFLASSLLFFLCSWDPDNSVYCRITVQFTSADPVTDKSYWATGGSAVFNAEEGNWQFASAGIVAPNNCTYIRVVLQMNRQMNFADFTGIYLYPEAFGTQYIYDKNGNRKTRKMLYGGQEKSEFDDADNLTKHTAAGRTVSSTFHYGDTEAEQKKHLLLKSIAPLGSVSKFSYDNFGNPLTSQVQNADANPSYFIRGETTYTDDGNYVTEQKDARGKIVRTETDPQRGTTTSVTDAKGQTVEYKYDELRRIVKTSAKMGAKAGIPTVHNEYTYDEQRGNLVEIRHNTDGDSANDVVYSFEQDALGRQTAVKVGNQILSQSAYQNDPTKPNFGTLTATTYGNGAKVSSRYDDFNRVTGVVYGEETAPRYEYDYNAKGQVARVRDNLLNRTTQSEYDLANRPVRVKTAEADQHVYTGQVAYDNVYGNLSEFTEKVGENRQEFGTKFGYDDENRPTSLTYSIGATTIGQSTTTIDKLNRTTFSAVKLGSKTFTSEYHFAAGGYGTGSVTNLVASITQPGFNCGYGYDDNGNIASATLNGKWTGYTYDALGQLVQVNDHSDTRSGENGTTWKYTYDLGGNILKKERFAYADTTTPLETVTYTYGDANWRDKLTAVNGNAIRYDAIGNPLSDGTWTYIWQNGRQLQKMQKAGVTAEFVYNADGLRVQKTVNGVATKYTLHGKNIVHMTSGTDELHFFYDAQNRPAVVVYNGAAYAYVKSLQGDIVAILDENGNTVVSYGYDAWGAPLWCTGELAETLGKVQPFRYRGYVFDEETGLYYLRSRYYNPGWGRFVNADNMIAELNLFTYCKDSPILLYDPNGKWSLNKTVIEDAKSYVRNIVNQTAALISKAVLNYNFEISEEQKIEQFFDDVSQELGYSMPKDNGSGSWKYYANSVVKTDGKIKKILSAILELSVTTASGVITTAIISSIPVGGAVAMAEYGVETLIKDAITSQYPTIPDGVYTSETVEYRESLGWKTEYVVYYHYLHGYDSNGYYYSAIWKQTFALTPFGTDQYNFIYKQRN